MGAYNQQLCPICGARIQTDVLLDNCPACKEYIRDRFEASGDGTGISTATAKFGHSQDSS